MEIDWMQAFNKLNKKDNYLIIAPKLVYSPL